MANSNEFQFFWSEGPLDWTSWLCLRSFTRYSGVTVHLYSYDRDLNPEILGCLCHDASEYLPREIYERVRSGFEETYGGASGYREAADLFRYKLLYERGEWYFDTDCLLLKPLTPLFDRDYVFGRGTVSVNNAVLKFPKGDTLLDQLFKECLQRSPLACLPGTVPLFNQYLKKFNLINQVLPRNYFYPISATQKYQQTISAEESSYILHLYTSNERSTFDQGRRIKLLEMQIETLNKSLGLRIARKIPFGKAIQKVLTKDKQELATSSKKLPSNTHQQFDPTTPEIVSIRLPNELITGLRDFTAQWERYIDDSSGLEEVVREQVKAAARILSGYLLKYVAGHEALDLENKADFTLMVNSLHAFGNWKNVSSSGSEFENMEKTGKTAYDLANKLISSPLK